MVSHPSSCKQKREKEVGHAVRDRVVSELRCYTKPKDGTNPNAMLIQDMNQQLIRP